jgi:hypothetical protein
MSSRARPAKQRILIAIRERLAPRTKASHATSHIAAHDAFCDAVWFEKSAARLRAQLRAHRGRRATRRRERLHMPLYSAGAAHAPPP